VGLLALGAGTACQLVAGLGGKTIEDGDAAAGAAGEQCVVHDDYREVVLGDSPVSYWALDDPSLNPTDLGSEGTIASVEGNVTWIAGAAGSEHAIECLPASSTPDTAMRECSTWFRGSPSAPRPGIERAATSC
jgi:hypothetical protein